MNPYLMLGTRIGTTEAMSLSLRLAEWHDRMVAHECLQRSHRRHRLEEVEPTNPEREPVGTRFDEVQRAPLRHPDLRQQDRPFDAVGIHVVDEFRELRTLEEGIAALEIVLLDAHHPVGLRPIAHEPWPSS